MWLKHLLPTVVPHARILKFNYDSKYLVNDAAGEFAMQQPAEEQHIVSAVRQWFAAKGNMKWLLVIDNCDDLDSFDLSDYIPPCRHGTVIITSRRSDCVRRRRGVEVL